jgi:hypothetical protein
MLCFPSRAAAATTTRTIQRMSVVVLLLLFLARGSVSYLFPPAASVQQVARCRICWTSSGVYRRQWSTAASAAAAVVAVPKGALVRFAPETAADSLLEDSGDNDIADDDDDEDYEAASTMTMSSSAPTSQSQASIDHSLWWLLQGDADIGEWDHTHFDEAAFVIGSWRKGRTSSSAQPRIPLALERLLRRIVEEQRVGNPYADRVDMTALYTGLIEAWAACGTEPGCAQRAEEILDYFQSIYEEGDSFDPLLCEPGLEAWNSVIASYGRSGRPDAPQHAMRVLGKLYDLHHRGRSRVVPNKDTYART